jgi:site-specific recombinase XerD
VLNDKALKALSVCEARRSDKTSRVFLSRFGEPLDSPKAWFKLVMQDVVDEQPVLAYVTWHVFRHTFISRLVMAGVDLRTTQELAGHKDISMTVRYAHLSPDHKLDAIDRLMTLRATEEPAIEIKLDYPARRSG